MVSYPINRASPICFSFEEAVTRVMDEGHTVDVIYLDVAKAFDSVNHRLLLTKMSSFGLETCPFRGVLKVYVGGEISGAIPVRSGIQQGPLIGPLLFFLFFKRFPDDLEALMLLFADDIRMVTFRTQNMNLHSSLTTS